MIGVVLDAALLSGPLPWALAAAGACAFAFLLAVPRRRWWTSTVPLVLLGAAAVTVLGAALANGIVPDPLPFSVLAAVGCTFAAAGLGIAGFGRRGWRGRAAIVTATALVAIAAAQGVNTEYGEFPTLRTALGLAAVDQIPFTAVALREQVISARGGRPLDAQWRAPAGMPPTGVITQVDIPASRSGFAARPGWLYLPPAYLSRPRAQMPVLVLLSGQPGSPQDWLDGGRLAARLDAFAAAHDGLAPVVVMPDHLGSPLVNPLCMDSRLGDVATYLSVDVPAWIRATLQVDPDPRAWAIGGLSNGGTCSLQMAVAAPAVYPTFVDISGESEPTLGDRATTVQAAFAGDAAAFTAVNPLDVLTAKRFPATSGYLVAGQQDSQYLPQAESVLEAGRSAGMDVQLHVLPGGHTWDVWGPGLDGALPWLATRLGLTS